MINNTHGSDLKNQREVVVIPLEKDLISIRGLSPKRLRFEVEYGLEKGSTANSFLFYSKNNKNEAILIHPPGLAYGEVFLEALSKIVQPKEIKLKILVGHVNPNRVDFLKQLVKIYSESILICSTPGERLLREIWKRPAKDSNMDSEMDDSDLPKLQLIKKKETIFFDDKYILNLITTPTSRWPGGLIAFEETLGLLMSDKLFAAHICTKEWAEKTPSSTEEERRHYFDCLMSPMTTQIDSIVEELEDLDIRTIAPGHGPAIDGSWRSLLSNYRRWGDKPKEIAIKVLLIFASAYGSTASIADALSKGISKVGVKVESLNCEFTTTEKLVQAILQADAYLIGSPTLGGHAPTPIIEALGVLLEKGDRKKTVGVFGSYGWSGEALDLLENKLRDAGFTFGFNSIKIQFNPNPQTIKTLEETGTKLGRSLVKTKKSQKSKVSSGLSASKSNPSLLALGRIVGSLCILTASKGEEENNLSGAMVASWISQASFSPPGLSIAVAKDRAVEELLHSGDIFSLNILNNSNKQHLLQKFLQPFEPGANRFQGLNLETSPGKQPIIPEALAWLECCVKERMECGDHWLIYAEVTHGKVLNSTGVTAVHHRSSGATY